MEEEIKRIQKLKIKDILSDLKAVDIKNFVSSYARKDASFAIAFKSHFISRIQSEDQEKKYKKILGEIIKPKTVNNPRITQAQKKTINIIFEDFVHQMNDALSGADYKEAYFLTKESLDKIAYLQNRYSIGDISVEKVRVKFLDGMDMILAQDLAPSFRNYAENALIELVRKSYYIPKSYNLISVINSHHGFSKNEKEEIISELNVKAKNIADKSTVLSTLIELSHPHVNLAKELMINFDHSQIFYALKNLQSIGKYDFADFYTSNKKIQFSYQVNLLKAYENLYREKYQSLTESILNLKTAEVQTIDLDDFIDSLPKPYLKKEISNLYGWMESLRFIHQCNLLCKAEKDEKLLEILRIKNEIEWLKAYDSFLVNHGHEEDVLSLYLKYVEEYLSSHIGLKSAEFLNRLNAHLKKLGNQKIIKEVHNLVNTKFSHRKAIKKNAL